MLYPHLHSNMFLLFRISDSGSSWYCSSFTFQYVSIISEEEVAKMAQTAEFTFQYVSIISCGNRTKTFLPGRIYIPICFYYFEAKKKGADIVKQIYIPICFYYFQKKRQTQSLKIKDLHSNMFLLFRWVIATCFKWWKDLHSNMFLLFLDFDSQLFDHDR